jgi:hypothetical protein
MIIKNNLKWGKPILPEDLKKKYRDPKPNIGLGDRVERIAQPIARVIDRVAGTNIQGCGACQKRKEYLNKKFPKT